MKVSWWKGMRGKKDHTCMICNNLIPKGNVHMHVSLEVPPPAQYPVAKKCCYACFKAGRLTKGLEV